MSEQKQDNADKIKIYNQPESIKSLAAKYKVSYVTFRRWIKPIEHKLNMQHKKPFTPAELKIIIDFLGEYV